MSFSSHADLTSFEKILEGAFNVQRALMGADSFPGFAELRDLAMGQLEPEAALHALAARTREVGSASGVAIATRKGDELLYCAGSGTAASFVGRRMTATFILSSRGEAEREILRVEDAETDRRIEAAICRQFGSKSLLILPIRTEAALAGVLEIFFNAPHNFSNQEVSAYQAMAHLAGQAITRAGQIEEKKAQSAQANQQAVCPTCGAPLVHPKQSSRTIKLVTPTAVIKPAGQVRLHRRFWKLADMAAVATVLVISSWIAYTYLTAERRGAAVRQSSNATVQQASVQPSGSLEKEDTTTFDVAVTPIPARKTGSSPWKRVRVADNEMDYISDDVTVRHFILKPASQPALVGNYRVEYVSEDVTIRRFSRNPSPSNR